jgi:ferredoxin
MVLTAVVGIQWTIIRKLRRARVIELLTEALSRYNRFSMRTNEALSRAGIDTSPHCGQHVDCTNCALIISDAITEVAPTPANVLKVFEDQQS